MVARPSGWLHESQFGYFPQVPEDVLSEVWAGRVTPTYYIWEAPDESQLIDEGISSLQGNFENLIGKTRVWIPLIVPLSGGLDSRAILGALIDAGLRDQITAVTLETPGTRDNVIGICVAKRIVVRHETIDLPQVPLKQKMLEKQFTSAGHGLGSLMLSTIV